MQLTLDAAPLSPRIRSVSPPKALAPSSPVCKSSPTLREGGAFVINNLPMCQPHDLANDGTRRLPHIHRIAIHCLGSGVARTRCG